ncbi:hypothetical protein [uncultured Cocleimonas sp.]|jgi:hypothetical protein|uniref:hypothetical protein n=1 Tax=uncultured Cocleimonas sp. TaxID=1051587 RepID=UPI00261DB3A2|nr:hypothetical protein [uncultured Cocleimonas sp.]
MFLRILILIFAFNAFIPSAVAMGMTGNCMQMEDANTEMVMSHTDSKSKMSMNCEMSDMDKSCSDILCASGCLASTTSYLFSDVSSIYHSTDIEQPKSDLAYFYKIYLVINTPPPLV